MKTTNKIRSYGRLNTATIRACAKDKAFAKAMILAYIDQRANLPWVFCTCNVVNQTGITEKTVKHYIKELQAEGVLLKVPGSQYKGQMRSNMTYYSLDKAAYEARYWTVQEEQSDDEAGNEEIYDALGTDKGGNDYLEKGVTIPEKGGKDSRVKGVISSEIGGSHSDKGGNDSGKGGNGYREKGVTAAPIYRRVEEDEKQDAEDRQTDREKERSASLPASLSASPFSEVIKNSVNPFSQPMFVEDPNRPAPRKDDTFNKVTDQNKSESVKESEAGQLQKPVNGADASQFGRSISNGTFLNITDTTCYNYTIDGEPYELFFTEQESNAALSPLEKVAVLKHALTPLITTGEVDVPRASVLQVNGKTFEMASQLFEVNPSLPVSKLLTVLWECNRVACENPVKESGFKPCFIHRAATESLTYLLRNLDTINGTMPEDLRLPDNTVFLTVE